MTKKIIIFICACIVGLFCNASVSHAQFKEDIYAQDPNIKPSAAAKADTTKMFSFKDFAGGLAHKNKMKIGTMFAGSVMVPGSAQIYNKDYWKLPVIYGGIGTLAGTGGYYLHKYNITQKRYDAWSADKTAFEEAYKTEYPFEAPALDLQSKKTGTWLMAGAGLIYWATLLDGVVNYESDSEPLPGRATLYSALLPGLGQIYNGEYFKLPIYWGGLMVSVHCTMNFNRNYQRFKRIHNEATTDPNYSQNISGETAKWYRDVYRRYRDYSVVATAAVYLLQVIDANVFAYMHDFEVTEDLTMHVEPALISPYNAYAINTPQMGANNAFGMRIGLTF